MSLHIPEERVYKDDEKATELRTELYCQNLDLDQLISLCQKAFRMFLDKRG